VTAAVATARRGPARLSPGARFAATSARTASECSFRGGGGALIRGRASWPGAEDQAGDARCHRGPHRALAKAASRAAACDQAGTSRSSVLVRTAGRLAQGASSRARTGWDQLGRSSRGQGSMQGTSESQRAALKAGFFAQLALHRTQRVVAPSGCPAGNSRMPAVSTAEAVWAQDHQPGGRRSTGTARERRGGG